MSDRFFNEPPSAGPEDRAALRRLRGIREAPITSPADMDYVNSTYLSSATAFFAFVTFNISDASFRPKHAKLKECLRGLGAG
ncbi:hypothetical protein CEXT_466081 [Caerostris extrusa]|uniref:Uncharacterized protein n=1 Tax=Caerostris extrusa TaxID=172846 RepID=A0AAV4XWR8_CAEEX|nr:hypothetical protein CEXT_466081 [Caerostris extrusa]